MKKILFFVSFLVLMNSVIANNNEKAKELFENSKQKLSLKNVCMVLDLGMIDGKGNTKSKSLSVAFGEFNQEKKVMVEIIAPEKVKGTKILTTSYLDKRGIIEIYMPATGKIQKFNATNRNLKLMGSEIPIAQFSSVVESDYSFTLLGNDKVGEILCHKIKVQQPEEKEYGIAYVSVDGEYLLRVEKYDSKDEMLSLTELSDYIKVMNSKNKFYPKFINVMNTKSGRSSNMKVLQLEYVEKVNPANFQITNNKS